MKIDLTQLEIDVDFSGHTEKIDCTKTVANTVKNMTSDIGLEDACRELYHSTGPVDFPDEHADQFLELVLSSQTLLASVKRAIRDKLRKPVEEPEIVE